MAYGRQFGEGDKEQGLTIPLRKSDNVTVLPCLDNDNSGIGTHADQESCGVIEVVIVADQEYEPADGSD